MENNILAWAGTTWSGWGFDESPWSLGLLRSYTAEEANAIPISALTTNIVFNLSPQSMNSSSISQSVINDHLAMGIPALSKASGSVPLTGKIISNVNLQDNIPNGWWRLGDDDLDNKWLHSDIKCVAYFYIFSVYKEIIKKGNLK